MKNHSKYNISGTTEQQTYTNLFERITHDLMAERLKIPIVIILNPIVKREDRFYIEADIEY